MNEPIEAEHRALAVVEEPVAAPVALLGSDDPAVALDRAVGVANVLKKLIVAQGYAKKLGKGDREFVEVAGWQALGGFLDTFAKVEWSKPIERGFESRVVLIRRGQEVGAGEAICTRDERNWKDRDDFAIKSMSQTRAAGKAFRLTFGWLMTIAGYESTPQEEMVSATPRDPRGPRPPVESEAQVERRRAEGIARIHAYCRTHGIDTEGADSPYRKLLLTDPAFCHHFESPDSEVTSKALTLDELQRFSMALQALVRERQAAQ
jgi:hypothetical protein